MATEIELKVRVADRSAVVERLSELSAEPLGEVITSDVFLDTADGRLLAKDCGLRLRTEHGVAGGSDKLERAVVTYKGPRAPGPLKRREEIELALDDLAAAVELFERLGYRQKLRFEKHRESWRLGTCRVELDRVPRLGDFVEIEGPDDERIAAVRRDLGLERAEPVRESYAALIDAYLTERGIVGRELRFGPSGGGSAAFDHPPSG